MEAILKDVMERLFGSNEHFGLRIFFENEGISEPHHFARPIV